jgi:hypothetical protein
MLQKSFLPQVRVTGIPRRQAVDRPEQAALHIEAVIR